MHLMCVPKSTLRFVHHLLNLMKFVEFKTSFRSRSKSELPERIGAMKGHSNLDVNELKIGDSFKKKFNSQDAKCLTQEICQLEKQLEDQLVVRSALEKAFTSTSYSPDNENDENPITKPVTDLMKEISDLESQVVHLEKHLLSLYRETFDQNVPTLDLKSSHRRASSEVCWPGHFQIPSNLEEGHENGPIFILPADQSSVHSKKVMNSGINRSHSTLTGVDPYHSFPFSMLENSDDDDDDATSSILLARSGHLNHVSETPNWISEEMIKFISAIYCELASDPRFFDPDSPQVSFFSETDYSPHESDHTECRQISMNRSCSSHNSVAVMQFNYRDNQRLKTVKHMLWSFKLLVSRLERVDVKVMRYEEKLAFWINVHNALIMHAYIVYGIPYSNLRKKTSLVLKAAYIVGGHAISIEMIQNLILGCRLIKRQGQTYWLQSLFNLKTKLKAGSEHHVLRHYAVHDHEEHRLYFALCSGNRSDPMVRVFTPDRVLEELEAAKVDYIRTNIIIVEKKQKIILPKIVYLYARDSRMSASALVDTIKPFLSEEGKRMKKIEWMSHNFDFRYLIAKELIK